jgi:hypothetical protein
MASILRNGACLKGRGGESGAGVAPALLFAAAWTGTTSMLANWVVRGQFATKDFFRAIQEN